MNHAKLRCNSRFGLLEGTRNESHEMWTEKEQEIQSTERDIERKGLNEDCLERFFQHETKIGDCCRILYWDSNEKRCFSWKRTGWIWISETLDKKKERGIDRKLTHYMLERSIRIRRNSEATRCTKRKKEKKRQLQSRLEKLFVVCCLCKSEIEIWLQWVKKNKQTNSTCSIQTSSDTCHWFLIKTSAYMNFTLTCLKLPKKSGVRVRNPQRIVAEKEEEKKKWNLSMLKLFKTLEMWNSTKYQTWWEICSFVTLINYIRLV